MSSDTLFTFADRLHNALDEELAAGILEIERVETELRSLAFLLLLAEERRSIQ